MSVCVCVCVCTCLEMFVFVFISSSCSVSITSIHNVWLVLWSPFIMVIYFFIHNVWLVLSSPFIMVIYFFSSHFVFKQSYDPSSGSVLWHLFTFRWSHDLCSCPFGITIGLYHTELMPSLYHVWVVFSFRLCHVLSSVFPVQCRELSSSYLVSVMTFLYHFQFLLEHTALLA